MKNALSSLLHGESSQSVPAHDDAARRHQRDPLLWNVACEMAADALLLDATDLTLDEVIEKITRLARERGAGLFIPEGAELVALPGQGQEDKGSWAWAGDQSS